MLPKAVQFRLRRMRKCAMYGHFYGRAGMDHIMWLIQVELEASGLPVVYYGHT